jgi:hypothetical protein
MNKSVIFGLFLMASLLMGTSLQMNMFPTAMADGKDRDDKRYHYDGNNRYEQSTYEEDPYLGSYDQSYGYDAQPVYGQQQQPSYDKPQYDYSQTSYDSYSEYKTQDKNYECRTGPFEGFFVSSVEFCKHVKFQKDDRKDRDNNQTGPQGPQGPQGIQGERGFNGTQGPQGIQGERGFNGTQGIQGERGFNGTQGLPGENGTDFDPCVACLLDALAKLETGAVFVNVTSTIDTNSGTPVELETFNFTLIINVDVATLLQNQLGVTLGIGSNATIFEICAAIDAQGGLNVEAVLNDLEDTLIPIVTEQVQGSGAQIAAILLSAGINPNQIDALVALLLDAIDAQPAVDQILANVEASLDIFEACNEAAPRIQQVNPNIQQNSQVLPFGDSIVQLH